MTSLHHPVTPKARADRLRLYQAVERDWPEGDPIASWWQGYLDQHAQKNLRVSLLREWWERPEIFSPYLDEVALTRAFRDFDPQVIANLSDLEWQEFIGRLVVDPDKPWFETPPSKGLDRGSRGKLGVGTAGSGTRSWMSPRTMAWYRLPLKTRNSINRAIQTRNERLKREERRNV